MIERCPTCCLKLLPGHECPTTSDGYKAAETKEKFDDIVADLNL